MQAGKHLSFKDKKSPENLQAFPKKQERFYHRTGWNFRGAGFPSGLQVNGTYTHLHWDDETGMSSPLGKSVKSTINTLIITLDSSSLTVILYQQRNT